MATHSEIEKMLSKATNNKKRRGDDEQKDEHMLIAFDGLLMKDSRSSPG
jgi:hypothetical protein